MLTAPVLFDIGAFMIRWYDRHFYCKQYGMKQKTLLALVVAVCCLKADAQTVLKGKVVDDLYDRVVIGATIFNATQNKSGRSDMGGNYRISAAEGDKILFSSVGYISDSIIVTHDMLSGAYDIALTKKVVMMEEVEVGQLNPYQVDSISRREEFGDVLEKRQTNLVGGRGNAPTDGVGITFSPISRYSREEKNLRRFKKNYERQEKEYYIDYKFSYSQVSKVTGLTGDSLRVFMLKYRPDYKFCRRNSHGDMLVYINDSYREFMNKPGVSKEGEGKKKKREKK